MGKGGGHLIIFPKGDVAVLLGLAIKPLGVLYKGRVCRGL